MSLGKVLSIWYTSSKNCQLRSCLIKLMVDDPARTEGTPMVAPATEGIDLFKIANRSISGWVPSFKMGSVAAPVKLPFCSQLEERLLLWLEYHPLEVSYEQR